MKAFPLHLYFINDSDNGEIYSHCAMYVCFGFMQVLFVFLTHNQTMRCKFSAGLDNMKINVTHRMNSITFATINKLGSGLKKKSRKKKGKPGKVKRFAWLFSSH